MPQPQPGHNGAMDAAMAATEDDHGPPVAPPVVTMARPVAAEAPPEAPKPRPKVAAPVAFAMAVSAAYEATPAWLRQAYESKAPGAKTLLWLMVARDPLVVAIGRILYDQSVAAGAGA